MSLKRDISSIIVKKMNEIRDELENRRYVYPYPSVRNGVANFVKKKKILNAIKRKDGFVYVIRR